MRRPKWQERRGVKAGTTPSAEKGAAEAISAHPMLFPRTHEQFIRSGTRLADRKGISLYD